MDEERCCAAGRRQPEHVAEAGDVQVADTESTAIGRRRVRAAPGERQRQSRRTYHHQSHR